MLAIPLSYVLFVLAGAGPASGVEAGQDVPRPAAAGAAADDRPPSRNVLDESVAGRGDEPESAVPLDAPGPPILTPELAPDLPEPGLRDGRAGRPRLILPMEVPMPTHPVARLPFQGAGTPATKYCPLPFYHLTKYVSPFRPRHHRPRPVE